MIRPAIKAYPRATSAARAILRQHQPAFPLNVSRLLESIETHRIYDLSSQRFNLEHAPGKGGRLHPQKAWTIYSEQLDTYLVVWNATQSPAAIRYSVAHEIGHILLNHERAWPTDRTLTKRDKEAEANTFARCLLAPFGAVQEICHGGPFNARLVAGHFDIPYHAAKAMRQDYAYWLLAGAEYRR